MKAKRSGPITAVLLAAGRSRRMGGGIDKLFLTLRGRPVIYHSLRTFEQSPQVDQVLITCNDANCLRLHRLVRKHGFSKVKQILRGGRERSDSVAMALEQIDEPQGWVVIHDGARPLINDSMLRQGLSVAFRRGSAIVAAKVFDTLKSASSQGRIEATVDRSRLYAVQTPQIFRTRLILEAYREVRKRGLAVTDDAAAVEACGKKVFLFEYPGPNLKITRRQDIPLAEGLLRGRRDEKKRRVRR